MIYPMLDSGPGYIEEHFNESLNTGSFGDFKENCANNSFIMKGTLIENSRKKILEKIDINSLKDSLKLSKTHWVRREAKALTQTTSDNSLVFLPKPK